METYKDILCRQIDTLQQYFDSCAEDKEITDSKIHFMYIIRNYTFFF